MLRKPSSFLSSAYVRAAAMIVFLFVTVKRGKRGREEVEEAKAAESSLFGGRRGGKGEARRNRRRPSTQGCCKWGNLGGGIRRISKYVEKYLYIPSRKFLDYCLICFNFFGHNLRNLFYEHVAARSNECAFLIFHFLDLGPSFIPLSKGGSCMVERARSSPGKEWTRGKGKGEYSPQEEKPR